MHAAWRIEHDGTGSGGRATDLAEIKFHVAAWLGALLDRALQAHGALGNVQTRPIAWWYRTSAAARIYDWRRRGAQERSGARILEQRYGLPPARRSD